MRSKALGLVAITAVTAGCASNSGGWHPADVAQEAHIYAGGGLGQSSYDDSKQDIDAQLLASLTGLTIVSNTSTLDKTDTAFSAVLGYRMAPFFGTEVAYYRLGKERYNAVTQINVPGTGNTPFTTRFQQKTTGLGVSGLAILPIVQNWEIYGRGGFLLANTDFDQTQSFLGTTQGGSSSSDSSDFFVGFGGGYHYGEQWDIRLEYQRFLDVGNSDTGEVDIDTVGLQVMYSIF